MNLLIVAAGALAVGFSVIFLRREHIYTVGFRFIATLSIVAAVGIFGAVILIGEVIHAFNQPAADYDLESGEYMHCTQQGDKRLDCEIAQRKDDQ